MKRRIWFEDNGQDFLFWEVDDHQVTGCGPFQAGVWCGTTVLNPHAKSGEYLQIVTKTIGKTTLKHRVISNEALP